MPGLLNSYKQVLGGMNEPTAEPQDPSEIRKAVAEQLRQKALKTKQATEKLQAAVIDSEKQHGGV